MTEKPRILALTELARTRLFRVEALDLEFSNGNCRRFERIRGDLADSVLAVPLQDDGTLLLVREYAAGSDRYELGLPKGVVEPGEGLLEAANREIREEVGFAARDLRLLRTLSIAPAYIEHRTHVVLARGLYAEPAVGDEPEPVEVVPWSLDDLDALFAREDFSEARSIAALCLLRRFLQGELRKARMDESD